MSYLTRFPRNFELICTGSSPGRKALASNGGQIVASATLQSLCVAFRLQRSYPPILDKIEVPTMHSVLRPARIANAIGCSARMILDVLRVAAAVFLSLKGWLFSSIVIRSSLLILAGTAPVASIPLAVFGLLPMDRAAQFIVAPLAVAAIVCVALSPVEGRWAVRGFCAGLLSVSAYDATRIPLVLLHIWPDFIPDLGGWLLGTGHPDAVVGYLWRYIGDGGGIGLAYFVFCGAAMHAYPKLVTGRPVLLSIGYGVFVWSGLVVTVTVAPQGEQMLFTMTPVSCALSLVGHLIYGAVLGLRLRQHLGIPPAS